MSICILGFKQICLSFLWKHFLNNLICERRVKVWAMSERFVSLHVLLVSALITCELECMCCWQDRCGVPPPPAAWGGWWADPACPPPSPPGRRTPTRGSTPSYPPLIHPWTPTSEPLDTGTPSTCTVNDSTKFKLWRRHVVNQAQVEDIINRGIIPSKNLHNNSLGEICAFGLEKGTFWSPFYPFKNVFIHGTSRFN